MKKLKVALLLMVTLVLSLTAFAACNKEPAAPACSHETVAQITVDESSVVKTYNVGDTFTKDGMKLTAHCSNCGQDIVVTDLSNVSIIYQDGNVFKYGDTKVTVSYGGQTCDIAVTVNCVNHDINGQAFDSDETNHWKVCKICGTKVGETAHTYSLNVSGSYDTYYRIGDTFNVEGLVVSEKCSCGYSRQLTSSEYTIEYQNGSAFALGDTKVTVKVGAVSKDIEVTVSRKTGKIEGTLTVGNTTCKVAPAITNTLVANSGETVKLEISENGTNWVDYDANAFNYEAGDAPLTLYIRGNVGATAEYTAVSTTPQTFTVSHKAGDAYSSDDVNHWKVCACGEKLNEEAHNFENKSDDVNHWKECECGKKIDEAAHVYNPQKDADYHWTECSCGKIGEAKANHVYTLNVSGDYKTSYLPNDTFTTDKLVVEKVCACSYKETVTDYEVVYENGDSFTIADTKVTVKFGDLSKEIAVTIVNNVGEITGELVVENTTCKVAPVITTNTLAANSEATIKLQISLDGNNWVDFDANSFDYSVATGEESLTLYIRGYAPATTDYTEAKSSPVEFTVSHKAGDAYSSDGVNHWNVCACGEIMNVTAHTLGEFDNDADKHWNICSVCNAKIDATEEAHDVSTAIWENDDNNHWKTCECGEKVGVTAHVYEPKNDADGHWTECECGKIGEAKANHVYTLDIVGNYKTKYVVGEEITSADMKAKLVCDCGYATAEDAKDISVKIKGTDGKVLVEEIDVVDNKLTIEVSYKGYTKDIEVSITLDNAVTNFVNVDVVCGESITLEASAVYETTITYYIKGEGEEYREFVNGSTLSYGVYTIKAVAAATELYSEASLEKTLTVSHVDFEDFTGEFEYNGDLNQWEAKCSCGEVIKTVKGETSGTISLGLSIDDGKLVSSLGESFALDLSDFGDNVELVAVEGLNLTDDKKIKTEEVVNFFGEKDLHLTISIYGKELEVTYNALFISMEIATYEDLTKINSIVRLLPVETDAVEKDGKDLSLFGGYFLLVADITNTENKHWSTPFLWSGSALNNTDVFCGILDGNGHYVDGLVLNYFDDDIKAIGLTYNNNYSLVGANVGFGGAIKNIAFTNVVAETKGTLFANGATWAGNDPNNHKYPIIANYEDIYVSYKTIGWLNGTSKQIDGNSTTSVIGYGFYGQGQVNAKNIIIDFANTTFPYEEAKASTIVLGGFYNDLFNCTFNNVFVVNAPAGIKLIASGNAWKGTAFYGIDGKYYNWNNNMYVEGLLDGQKADLYQPSDTTYNFYDGYVFGNPELWADEAWVGSWNDNFWTVTKDLDGKLIALPYYKTMAPDQDGIKILGISEGEEISQGTSVELSLNRSEGYMFLELTEELEGKITLDGNVLTLGTGLRYGTEFKVKAIYSLDFDIIDEITLKVGYETKKVSFTVDAELFLDAYDDEGTIKVKDTVAELDLTNTKLDEEDYLTDQLADGITKLTIDGNVIEGAYLDGNVIKFNMNLIPVTCSGEVDFVFESFYEDEEQICIFSTKVLVITAKISNVDELVGLIDFYKKMPNNGGYYVLTNDITCDSSKSFGKNVVASGSTYSGDFLGTLEIPFDGTIDGKGHVIDNMLCSNNTSTGNGFINIMGSNAELKNVAFTNFKFGAYGGIVYRSFAGAKITNVYVDVAGYGNNTAGAASTWTWGACALFGSADQNNAAIFDMNNVVVDFSKIKDSLDALTTSGSRYNTLFSKAGPASTFNNVIVLGVTADCNTEWSGETNPDLFGFKNHVLRIFTGGGVLSNGSGYGIYVKYSDNSTNGVELPLDGWDTNYWFVDGESIPGFKFNKPIAFEGIASGDTLFKGDEITLRTNMTESTVFELADNYNGITLNGNVLTVTNDVDVTEITVVAKCAYDDKNTASITLKVELVTVVALEKVQDVDLQLKVEDNVVTSGDALVTIDLSEILGNLGDTATVFFDGAKIQENVTISDKKVNFNANNIDKSVVGAHTLTVLTAEYSISIPVNVITKGIKTAEDLKTFGAVSLKLGSKDTGSIGYFKVLNDIDFAGYKFQKADSFAEDYNTRFNGTFDGDGHVINNFMITDDAANRDYAFIGFFGETGVLKNIAFTNIVTRENLSFNRSSYAGAKVENAYFSYKIFGANEAGDDVSIYSNPTGIFLTNGDGTLAFNNVIFDLAEGGTYFNTKSATFNNNYGKYFGSIKNATFTNTLLLNVPTKYTFETHEGDSYYPISIHTGYDSVNKTPAKYYTEQEIKDKGLYIAFTDSSNNGVALPLTGWSDEYWYVEGSNYPVFKVGSEIAFMGIEAGDVLLRGESKTIETNYGALATLELADSYKGITLDGNVITVANEVDATEIEVTATCVYDDTKKVSITLTIDPHSIVALNSVQDWDLQLTVKDDAATSGDALVTISLDEIKSDVGSKATLYIDGEIAQSDVDILDKKVSFRADNFGKNVMGAKTIVIITDNYNISVPVFVISKGIYTPDDLRSIGALDLLMIDPNKEANMRYGYYKLMNDIDFSSSEGNSGADRASYDEDKQAITIRSLTEFGIKNYIGDSNKYFAGTFDGNGFAIKNMSMVDNKWQVGTGWAVCSGNEYYFFGQIHGGTVKNLAFIDLVLGEKSAISRINMTGNFTNVYVGIKLIGSNNDYTSYHSKAINNSGLFNVYSAADDWKTFNYTNVVVDYTAMFDKFNELSGLNDTYGSIFGCINGKDKFSDVMILGIPSKFINNENSMKTFIIAKAKSGSITARYTLEELKDKGIYVEYSDGVTTSNNGATLPNNWNSNIWYYVAGSAPAFKVNEPISFVGLTEGDTLNKGSTTTLSTNLGLASKFELDGEYAGVSINGNKLVIDSLTKVSSIKVIAKCAYNEDNVTSINLTIDVLSVVTLDTVQDVDLQLKVEDDVVTSGDALVSIDLTEIGEASWDNVDVYFDGVKIQENVAVSDNLVKFRADLISKNTMGAHTICIKNTYYEVTIPVLVISKGIKTAEDLKTFGAVSLKLGSNSEGSVGYFKVLNDIDFTGYKFQKADSFAENYNTRFNGIFDGDGHVIDNFMITDDAANRDYAFIGYFGEKGVLKNIAFTNVISRDNLSFNRSSYAGAKVENAYFSYKIFCANEAGDDLSIYSNPTGIFLTNGDGTLAFNNVIFDLAEGGTYFNTKSATFNNNYGKYFGSIKNATFTNTLLLNVPTKYSQETHKGGSYYPISKYNQNDTPALYFTEQEIKDSGLYVSFTDSTNNGVTLPATGWSDDYWYTAEGIMPIFKSALDKTTLVDFVGIADGDTVTSGTSITLNANRADVKYSIEEKQGVSINGNVISVSDDATGDIVITVTSYFDESNSKTITVSIITLETVTLTDVQKLSLDLGFNDGAIVRDNAATFEIDLSDASLSEKLGATADVYAGTSLVKEGATISDNKIVLNKNLVPANVFGEVQFAVITNNGSECKINIPFMVVSKTVNDATGLDMISGIAKAIANETNTYDGYFVIGADIAYDGTWKGVAAGGTFLGTIDGDNHEISGINASADNTGFIGGTFKGVLKNLTLNVAIKAKTAAIAENGDGAKIENVNLTTSFSNGISSSEFYGGLFKASMNNCDIKNVVIKISGSKPNMAKANFLALGVVSPLEGAINSTFTNVKVVDAGEWTTADIGFSLFAAYDATNSIMATYYQDGTCKTNAEYASVTLQGVSVVTSLD